MKTVILGGGESGTGAALLAKARGHEVFLSEKGTLAPRFRDELEAHGIPYEEGRHTMARLLAADVVVKSPGIPRGVPVIRELLAAGIEVIGEIEWAWRQAADCRIIGITGSNGKTTTTLLTGHLLREAGREVAVGGNVGQSFARNLLTTPASCHVLELSSFQLDDISTFRPDVAAILNITPDHLDRYDYQMSRYVESKFRIAMNQQEEDLLIVNADDPNSQEWLSHHPVQSRLKKVPMPRFPAEVLEVEGHQFDMSRTALKGPHNFFNAAVAVTIALNEGVAPQVVQRGLATFRNAPHRLEVVAHNDGIAWINDSKATNVDAVRHALEAMDGPVIWIAGGTDKGNDYGPLRALVRQKVKALICLGLDNRPLREAFEGVVPRIVDTRSMQAAVAEAARWARPGDVVLLSPACASFDLFKNYTDRGDQFREAVRQLLTEHKEEQPKERNKRE